MLNSNYWELTCRPGYNIFTMLHVRINADQPAHPRSRKSLGRVNFLVVEGSKRFQIDRSFLWVHMETCRNLFKRINLINVLFNLYTWGKKKRKFNFLNTESLFVNKLI